MNEEFGKQDLQQLQSVIQMSTVTDPVDRYRHGVLLGNYVEDKFGRELLNQERKPDPKKLATSKDYHDPAHSLYKPHPIISQKEAANSNFYETSKNYQAQYKKPQDQTSYHIFHRQEVIPQVPLIRNDPKREEVMKKQGKLYEDTRYYLANKFGGSLGGNQSKQPVAQNDYDRQMLRQTGNLGNIYDQEIPDILTGEIWKPANQKPDADTKVKAKNYEEPVTKIGSSINAKSINPFGATTIVKPEVAKFDQQLYKRYVLPNDKGEQRDTLFGHGIQLQQFQRRQLATAYDLSYNQKVPPQTQINSFYNPDGNMSAKKFHRETVLQKNHQQKIPEYGTKTLLGQQKVGRPYDPYTKTFDKNHLKHEYLRK